MTGSDSDKSSPIDQTSSVEEILEQLLPSDDFQPRGPAKLESVFELLDEAPNSRKLMNYLFHSSKGDDCRNGRLERATSLIAGTWFEEEKRASSQLTPAALQLDTPVIFSWSKKATGTKVNAPVDRKHNTTNETTNQILFKSISLRLNEITKHTQDIKEKAESAGGSADPESSLRKQQWAVSEFHVDPLQPFVARALPRESKKENTTKKKAKRRSLLHFWGFSSDSKRKDKPKATEEQDIQEAAQQRALSLDETPEHAEKKAEKNIQKAPSCPPGKQASPVPSASAVSMSSFVPLQPKKK